MARATWRQDLRDKAGRDSFRALQQAFGKTNAAPFRGQPRGRVILAGVSGSPGRGELTKVILNFAALPSWIPVGWYDEADFARLVPPEAVWQE